MNRFIRQIKEDRHHLRYNISKKQLRHEAYIVWGILMVRKDIIVD